VRVILDHPRRHLWLRARRWIGDVAGGLLLVLGLTASIPAVPASLAVVSFVLGWATTEPSDPDRWPTDDVPVQRIILAWAVVTPAAIGGVRVGLRVVRRNRRLVLFLRRFRYDDAQSAVTFAVLRTIGTSWRMVTLDDAEMAPIGVAAGARRVFGVGHVVSKHVLAFGQLIGLRAFPVIILAMWGVLALGLARPAIEFARTGVTTPEAWITAVDPFLTIAASVFEGRPPLDAVAPTLAGVFAILAMAAAISFMTLIATMAALLLAFPLSTMLFFLSSSADSVREAERSKAVAVGSVGEMLRTADAIAQRSRKVFGPRLVVVRVASAVWQRAVSELAARSSLPLIDVSEPTEHVLWEVEELITQFGDRCVLIGQYDRVAALADVPPGSPASTPIERRLAHLLEGRDVLAYTTDPKGLRRFARALRGELLTRTGDVRQAML
jgi:hypothetical protein